MNTKISDRNRRRWGHVINNAVLYVYKDIINDFVLTVSSLRGLSSVRIFEDVIKIPRCTSIYKDYHNTFPGFITAQIQDQMVVPISDVAAYYNRTSETYGPCIDVIREETKKYMNLKYQGNLREAQQHIRQIRREVHVMTKHLLYIDREVLTKWQNHERDSMEIYTECNDYVREMFKNLPDKLDRWVEQMSMYYPLPSVDVET